MDRTTLTYVRLEADTFTRAAGRTVNAATGQAQMLADIGQVALRGIEDLFFDAEPEELRSRATRLRGAVLHAFAVSLDLLVQVGRLEQLAELRERAASDEV